MFRLVIKETDEHIHDDDFLHVLLTEKDRRQYTPLLLSAYLGQVDLFKIVMEHKVCTLFAIS